MESADDTIAAIATPLGEGGIGVVRISGPRALEFSSAIFRPAQRIDLATAPTHTCYFGSLLFPPGAVIDQAIVTLFRAPHSYTGDDVVEISAHGSPYILNQVLQALVRQGARLAQPGEFSQRAFLSGKLDLTQAEAVADLIRAKTDKAHLAAMSQLEGHLSSQVRSLRDRLLPLLAHVEVGLDHSDENHDFLTRDALIAQCQQVQIEIEKLLASSRVGKILREGLRVALVGRPNVGKSSLLNALLKEDRAIVTPIPGTTRDTLDESVNWGGIPVVLTDTAGLREGQDSVEKLGIERSRKALQQADVVLCVLDASEPLSGEDKRLIAECQAKPHVWVVNKSDLPVQWQPDQLHALNGSSPTVAVSAKTGDGLPDLVRTLIELSWQGANQMGEAHWMINLRHQTALQRAHSALLQASEAAKKDAFEECVALELTTALHSLGEIIGESVTEDLLDQIFSKFCVGK